LQSLPKLVAPGAVLVGCDAGFLNGAKIKGSHLAMKTGLLAAETIHAAARLESPAARDAELALYPKRVRESWVWSELYAARNFGPGIARLGTKLGGALAFVEQNLLRGHAPYTLRNRVPDHARLARANAAPKDRVSEARRRRRVRTGRAPCSSRARHTKRTSPAT
jgi:electron-transferring-flavoprotein dehydrogenase